MLRRRVFLPMLAILFSLAAAVDANAQFREAVEEPTSPSLGESITTRWVAGLRLTTGQQGCRNVYATAPVPTNWPEQRVRVEAEDISPGARLTYRDLPPGVKQMVIAAPSVRPNSKFQALVTLEVERFEQIPPEDTSIYHFADSRQRRAVSAFLKPSPYIESTNSTFRNLFNEVTGEIEGDWDKVAAIYDWVRDNIEYRDKQELKGAVKAIRDGFADCEDMTGAFIAICRAGGVPARMVWVQGHCYPEFFLVDDKGEGQWFPCQVAGTYAFGGMPDLRIILQKGDMVRVPEKKTPQRYAAEFLKADVAPPRSHEFVRQLLAN